MPALVRSTKRIFYPATLGLRSFSHASQQRGTETAARFRTSFLQSSPARAVQFLDTRYLKVFLERQKIKPKTRVGFQGWGFTRDIMNMLIQMGLKAVSVDGMMIKHARTFILRCHACFTTTKIMTKQFCPGCGNKTLKRVAVSVDEDGTTTLFINYKKPINIRGTRFSLPTPKGGKHANNPILCEDQPVPQNRLSKMALSKVDALDPDYLARNTPFKVNDVYSRSANLNVRAGHLGSRNPNQVKRNTGNHKKRRQ